MSEKQRVKLIFAAKQKLDVNKGGKVRVSIKNDWIYDLMETPAHTIGFTLKKFKIAQEDTNLEIAKKYRVYRVREDPKTRYRYVTEILNKDEGRQLINKKYCQILIAHHSLVKNPQEDFKNLLDEAERKQIRAAEEKQGDDKEKEAEENSDEEKKDPVTQSSAPSQPSQSSSQPSSNKSSQGSASKRGTPKQPRKRASGPEPASDLFSESEMKDFVSRYPRIEVCGKSNDLFKCSDVLSFVKETSGQVYEDLEKMQKQLLNPMNSRHAKMVNLKSPVESYTTRVTQSYINIRCGTAKKCRFAIWYKYEKNSKDEPIQIKWFRTINNNHDLCHHKSEKQY